MKKVLSTLLALVLVVAFALPAIAASAAAPILFINGQRIVDGTTPVVDKAGVFVPYKPAFEKLGYTTAYDSKTKTYVIKKSGVKLTFTVGSKAAAVNGQKKTLTIAPKAIGSTIYVPITFFNETLKTPAVYDKTNGVVQIGKTAAVDQFFKLSFGLTVDQVKKLEKNKLTEADKDEDGNDYLAYYGATLPNGKTGSIEYFFEAGKLTEVHLYLENNADDFDAALLAYDADKTYLEKLYNKGVVADDVMWYADEDVQAQYAEEFPDDDYNQLYNALNYGDADFGAQYKSAAFTVGILLTNANAFSEEEDAEPYYTEVISYVKN